MTTSLPKEEKVNLINSHKRNLGYRKYSLELDVLVENAKNNPDENAISNYEASIDEIDAQVAALDAELATVNALAE
jgi:hypothetical protein